LTSLGELVEIALVALAIIIPVRYFLVQPFYVRGASMEPSFYDHEYLIIDELSYRFRDPERGDIVVFRYPLDPSQFFIKRIIGLPGERVRLSQGKILIANAAQPDGLVLPEPYLGGAGTPGERSVVLGEEEYFVMGDNRNASLDSRIFGPVKRKFIVGRVWLRGWPLPRIGYFATPEYNF
jgi:signal peptidase I